jgi:histone-arginine methyltransferase CARM1
MNRSNETQRKDPDTEARDPTYFQYYAQFVHQQNMLQDNVRTSMYYSAIISNSDKFFKDKKIMDLGAGSGILSYFAVQAGAEHVYAIEASSMARHIKKLVDGAPEKNRSFKGKITAVPCMSLALLHPQIYAWQI